MFLRTTSHEIRTPMNSVNLGLDLLRKELLQRQICCHDIDEIINDISDSSQVCLELVSELLTHDKLEQGAMQLERRPTHIWSLITDTVRPFFTQVCYAMLCYESIIVSTVVIL